MSQTAVNSDVSTGLSQISVQVQWHTEWSPAIDAAFEAMPDDPLMDPVFVRALWDEGVGKTRQKIAVLSDPSGTIAGIVPLQKRDRLGWQFLVHYVMPYSRFFVRPEYTDAALHALRSVIDCANVVFYQAPADTRMLRPEEAWVVDLPATYSELMHRTKYAKRDRQRRQRAAGLTLREDDFSALPEALDAWQAKWVSLGSPATAARKDKMLLGYQALAKLNRLKTFSLHDGEKLAAMQINIFAGETLCGMTTVTRDEYRSQQAGIRCLLASMEWACANGVSAYDMMPTGGQTKQQWAVPQTKSYRVICAPLGSVALGCALESVKSLVWELRYQKLQRRKKEDTVL